MVSHKDTWYLINKKSAPKKEEKISIESMKDPIHPN